MPTDEQIGKHIQDIRVKRKMTQEELAARIGISKSSISEWEACKRVPRMETLRKIAEALGVDVWEIIGFSNLDDIQPPIPYGEAVSTFTMYNLSEESENLLMKWRGLDEYGKKAVTAVMEVELSRIQHEIDRETRED